MLLIGALLSAVTRVSTALATLAPASIGAPMTSVSGSPEALWVPMTDDVVTPIVCDGTPPQVACEALALYREGRLKEALAAAQYAKPYAVGLSDPRKAAVLMFLIGEATNATGAHAEAADFYRTAGVLFERSGLTELARTVFALAGRALQAAGKFCDALDAYLDAFPLAAAQLRASPDDLEPVALDVVGGVLATADGCNGHLKALPILLAAADLLDGNRKAVSIRSAVNLAIAGIYRNQLQDAGRSRTHFESALREALLPSQECPVAAQYGSFLAEMGEFADAATVLVRAGATCEAAADSPMSAVVFARLAAVHQKLNDNASSTAALRELRRICRDDDTLSKPKATQICGNSFLVEAGRRAAEGDYLASLPLFEDAVHYLDRAGDDLLLGGLWGWMDALSRFGRWEETADLGVRALELAERGKAPEKVVASLLFLGTAEGECGRLEEAFEHLERGAQLARQSQAHEAAGDAFIELGDLEVDRSQLGKALAYFHDAATSYQAAESVRGDARAQRSIADVRLWSGDSEGAANYYLAALELSRRADDKATKVRSLANLFLVEAYLGRKDSFLRHAEELRALVVEMPSPVVREDWDVTIAKLFAHRVIGQVVLEGDSPGEAARELESMMVSYGQMPHPPRELVRERAIVGYYAALAYQRAGNLKKARELYLAVEQMALRLQSPEVYRVRFQLGSVYEQQENYDRARELYSEALEGFERVGGMQRLEDIRLSLHEQVSWGYESLVRLWINNSRVPPEERMSSAYLWNERGRARVLLQLLQDSQVDLRAGVDKSLAEELEAVDLKMAGLQRALSVGVVAEERRDELVAALERSQMRREGLHAQIAARYPSYASVQKPELPSLKAVQAALDDTTAFLEYLLGQKESYLWVITATDVRVFTLPSRDTVDTQIAKFVDTLRSPIYDAEERAEQQQLAKNLYSILVQQAATIVAGKTRIIIAPDGSLNELPFEALISDVGDGAYLGEQFAVSYIPSGSLYLWLRKEGKVRSGDVSSRAYALLAIGDPVRSGQSQSEFAKGDGWIAFERAGVSLAPLPHAQEEVQGIARAIRGHRSDADLRVGADATEKLVREADLTKYRLLHFATHAIAPGELKWITQPSIVLATSDDTKYDGLLQMGEIFNLQLNADLVVLSACDTGRGRIRGGEGVIGLTRAFLYAGSSSVVASLWSVYDESTKKFMEHFYEHLSDGEAKATALKMARVDLMKESIWSAELGREVSLSDPYFWAPFVMVGSPD